MRRLADRLGVVPMALYTHVESKEDLLGGMIDELIEAYDPPAQDQPWKQAFRDRVLSARRVLLAHPWARPVFETRTKRTPAVLRHMDTLTGILLTGGLSAELAHYTMHALGHRIWGFSPEAFTDPDSLSLPDDPDARAAMIAAVTREYPHIAAVAIAAAGGDISRAAPGCDEQAEFEFALDLVLDAVERLQSSGRTVLGEHETPG